jgi:zinc transport system substrate-binding protein
MSNNWKSILTLLLIGILALLTACQSNTTVELNTSTNPDAIPVGVTAAPQVYFAERIGGDHIVVTAMLPLSENPVTYTPSEERVQAFGQTAVFFFTGIPSEDNWLANVQAAADGTVFVDLRDGIDMIDGNPYTWLAPSLAQRQAQTIYDALIAIDPAHQADYQANFSEFTDEITQLGTDMGTILNPVAGKSFIASYPAWAYFAREYNLEMHSVADIYDTPADEAHLATLAGIMQENGMDVIFVHQDFENTQTNNLVAQVRGGRTIPLNPFNPSWANNMRSAALLIESVLNAQPAE